jgi:hypothetical protein
MSGGLLETAERPDAEPSVVIDLMSDGFAIERNPVPAASIVARGVAAEAVLQRLSESASAEAFGWDGGPDEEPFASKPLTGDPAEVFGGIQVIGGDAEGAQAFIRQLIGAVERPEESGEVADMQEAAAEAAAPAESGDSRSGAMLMALRRSRVGKAAAVTAISVGGILGFGAASAKALTPLEQECVDAGMKRMNIPAAKFYGAHKNDGNGWHGRVRAYLDAMPQKCTDNGIYRVINERVQLQNGEHPARWSMIYPWAGSEWNGRATNNGQILNDALNGGSLGFDNMPYLHNHNWTKWAYTCRPGPAKTQVRLQEVHTVIQTDGIISNYGYDIDGKINTLAGETIYNRPFKVYGAC